MIRRVLKSGSASSNVDATTSMDVERLGGLRTYTTSLGTHHCGHLLRRYRQVPLDGVHGSGLREDLLDVLPEQLGDRKFREGTGTGIEMAEKSMILLWDSSNGPSSGTTTIQMGIDVGSMRKDGPRHGGHDPSLEIRSVVLHRGGPTGSEIFEAEEGLLRDPVLHEPRYLTSSQACGDQRGDSGSGRQERLPTDHLVSATPDLFRRHHPSTTEPLCTWTWRESNGRWISAFGTPCPYSDHQA